MAKKKCFTYVDGDDWVGLYVNGHLVDQGHSIPLFNLFKHLGVEVSFVSADLEWLGQCGHLPDELSEVQEESA